MTTMQKAEKVRKKLEQKFSSSIFFSGIEIAAFYNGVEFTDEPCVRILVNEKGLNHNALKLPFEMNGIKIEIVERTILPL